MMIKYVKQIFCVWHLCTLLMCFMSLICIYDENEGVFMEHEMVYIVKIQNNITNNKKMNLLPRS